MPSKGSNSGNGGYGQLSTSEASPDDIEAETSSIYASRSAPTAEEIARKQQQGRWQAHHELSAF